MIRGLYIKTKSSFSSKLLSVLNCVNIDDYNWHIIDKDTLSVNDLDINGILSGFELKHYIKNSEYSIYNFNVRAFPIGFRITEPMTYKEYIDSNCYLALFFYDCEFLEFYCKDINSINNVYDEYKNDEEVEEIEFITDDNDQRYKFYV